MAGVGLAADYVPPDDAALAPLRNPANERTPSVAGLLAKHVTPRANSRELRSMRG